MSLGTQLNTNFRVKAELPNFDRDVIKTFDELVSDEVIGYYAKGHIVYCEEDDTYYGYTGDHSDDCGYFKPLSLGGGLSFEEPNPTWNLTTSVTNLPYLMMEAVALAETTLAVKAVKEMMVEMLLKKIQVNHQKKCKI